MRITPQPEHHMEEGHCFFSTLATAVLMDSTVVEGEVAFLWDRQDPLVLSMSVEMFPGAEIVYGSRKWTCVECTEVIGDGELVVHDLDTTMCTTCAPLSEDMEAVWTVSLDQIVSALEDAPDRPADQGDIQMNRHLGSRLKMRLHNGSAWCWLDFSVPRMEQLVNAVAYQKACNGGADELMAAYINDGIRGLEEFLND